MLRRGVASATGDRREQAAYPRWLRATARVLLVALTTLLAPPALPAPVETAHPASRARLGLPEPGDEALERMAQGLREAQRLVQLPVQITLAALAATPAGTSPVARPVRAARLTPTVAVPPGAAAPPAAPVAAPAPVAAQTAPKTARASHWPSTLGFLPGGSTQAWLAALAAVPPPGEAPALVRQTTLPAGWSLVSVPLVASNTQASSVFASLPSPPYVYDYAGGQTLGVGEPGFRSVVPGRAFWVLLRQPQSLSISGLAINPTVEARLPLAPGWNTLATPWLSSVEWTDARVSVRSGSQTVPLSEAVTRGWIDASLYQYDAASALFVSVAPNAVPAGELRVWEGSALHASVTGELLLAPPPPDTQPPAISLSPAPVDGQVITAPTDIVGSVDDPNLAEWRLELAPTGTSAFTPFALGTTPVTNATLGTLDPTLLLNGQYEVRFVATDVFGQTSTLAWTIVVKDDLKVGNFTLSFLDLEVPLAGLPIRVTRTYDSRDKGRGDFGIGWRLELSNIRIDENLKAGSDWQGTSSGVTFPTYCVVQARQHRVTITLPDGRVLQFEPTVTPQCQQLVPLEFVTLGWRALPGTLGALESLDNDPQLLVAGAFPGPLDLLDLSTVDLADPNLYRLTLPDGRAFVVHQQNGVQSITDLNGNVLTVGPGGVTHNSGTGVAFMRDGLGRITKITDPNGNFMAYAYDAHGDLVTYSDRENNATTFTYNGSHGLLTITDPLGRQPIRNDYDASGRLIRHTDAFGKTIEYTHDLDGRQEIVTDRLGGARVLTYDERGNVVHEVDQEGHVTTRTFDARNNRVSETDPNGNTTSWTYDASDNVTSVTDPLGHVSSFTFNTRRQALTVTDANGKTTTNAYDVNGNLTSITDSAGQVTSFAYDARGRLLTRTDALGRVSAYGYDASGRLSQETDTLGHTTAYTYDANGNRLSETSTRALPGGGTETLTTLLAYDKLGRLTQVTRPAGGVMEYAYDAVGRQLGTVDPTGRTTSYAYDAMGRLLATTHPDGHGEALAYDAEGRRLSLTDGAGRVTLYEYDAVGRLTRTTHSDGSTVAQEYDAAGRPVAVVDAAGARTVVEYDAAGRRTKVTDALGRVMRFTYDAAGHLLTAIDPAGRVTGQQYDDLGRRVRTLFADGSDRRFTYDALGHVLSETDPAGRVTQFAYDFEGRLASVTDALGQVTSYAYDELGRRVTLTDVSGHVTRLEYDSAGRLVRRVLPDGAAQSFAYDAAGRLTARTDPNGATVTYAYDSAGRLAQRLYPDGGTVSFTYTPAGQRASVADARGTTLYAYDALDRLARVTYPDGRRLDYAYDARGARVSLTAAVGTTVLTQSYTYDVLARLQTVTDPLGRDYSLAYDTSGNRQSLAYPNGVQTVYGYDSLDRLTSLVSGGSAGTVQSYAYALGPAGHRTQVTEADGTTRAYGYDALYRLTGEQVTLGATLVLGDTYTYDAVGNRSSRQRTTPSGTDTVAYGYDSRDRLLTENASTLGYDANGNLTSRSGDAVYAWDYENRLVRVEKSDGTVVEHAYDADGNRVRTKVTPPTGPPAITDYLVDSSGELSHVVAESDASGTLTAFYVRSDDLLAVVRPGAPTETRYFHADGLGSIRALTDESGAVTDTYTYTAFGELLQHTGSDPQPYTFAGEPRDANTGFSYNRARWLDPALGRFISADPFGGRVQDPPSLHRYLYAGADPVDNVDPTGRFEFSIAGLSVSISISNILSGIGYGALFGALTGAADAYLRGDDVLAGALEGGLIGAALGPLFQIKFVGTVLVVLGEVGGVIGVADALEQDNYQLAAFRSFLVLLGAVTFFRTPPGAEPVPPPPAEPPGPPPVPPGSRGGRLGNAGTRQQNYDIATELENRGWTITGGGGRLPEEYLPGPGGGRRGSNWVDITATKSGRTLRVNTVDTYSNGTPTAREAAAAALIRSKTPSDHLLLVPKQ